MQVGIWVFLNWDLPMCSYRVHWVRGRNSHSVMFLERGNGGWERSEEKSIFLWRGLQRWPCTLLPAVLVEIKSSHPSQHTVLQPYAPRLVAQPFLRGQSLVTLVAPTVLPSYSHPSPEATWPSIPVFSRGAEPLPTAVRPPHTHFQFSMMRR